MTYLNLLLALPLLAAAEDPDPLRALPADAALVISMPDLPGAIERGRDNAWYRFFADEEVLAGLLELALEDDSASFFTDGSWALVPGLLAEVESAALAFDADFEIATLALRARGDGARLAELLPGLVGAGTDAPLDADLRAVVGEDATWARSGRLVVLDVSDEEGGLARVGAALSRAKAETGGLAERVLALSRPHGPHTPDLEVILRFEALAEAHAESIPEDGLLLADLLNSARSLHLTARAGAGEDVDVRIDLTYVPDSVCERLFSSLAPLPANMLDGMPKEAIEVSAFQWNVDEGIRTAMEFIEKYSPDEKAELEGTVAELEEAAGVNVIDDVLRSLSGGLMVYTLPLESEMERLGEDEAMTVLAFNGRTYVLGLADTPALVESLDRLIDAFGLSQQLERSVEGDHVFYEVLNDIGSVAAGFGAGRAVVSYDLDLVRETLARAALEKPSEAWQGGLLAADLKGIGGAWLYGVTSTREVMLSLASVLDTLPMIVGEPTGEEADLLDLLYVLFEPARVDEHFSGTVTTRATRTAGRLSFETIGR